jgi:hypothetical protein
MLRMRLRRKIPAFIFGVSIGIIIGGAFFVFNINEMFRKVTDNARSQITVIQQPVEKDAKPVKKPQPHEPFKINLSKSKPVNYREADSLIKSDSDINIATEELQSVKSVKVIHIGDNIAANDTLAPKMTVRPSDGESLYFIEFWKTPLNSRGYRFTKNKIMLYGFQDYSNVLLYELDAAFYIKSGDLVYRLFYSSDFRPLERVFDTDLLAKIN